MDKPNNDNSVKKEETTKLLTKTNTAKYSTNSTKVEMTKKDGNSEKKQKSKKKKTAAQTEIDIEKGTSPSKCDNNWLPVTFKELPDWLKDNDFIHKWYRPPLPSIPVCLRSILRIHTETGNIWTHLLGAVAIMVVAMQYYLSQDIVAMDKLFLLPFFVGALSCLVLSTLYHTLHCHSPDYCVFTGKMDYVGITLMIVGSYVPWVYFSFYCHFLYRAVYLTSIVVLAAVCVVLSSYKKFGTPEYRTIRATMFVLFAFSGLAPLIHLNVAMGARGALVEGHLAWFYAMAVLYLTGTFLYARRIPERFFPGKFDLVLHSHQIFHVLVVAAAFSHLHGIERIIDTHSTCDV